MSDKKEYIEREAVLDKQMEICHWNGLHDSYDDFVAVKDILAIPAADVEAVRHGHWYFACVHQEKKFYKCSNCHHAFPFNNVNYCPNCGAKMDEKGEE